MTQNKKEKRAARDLAAREGIPYTEALRRIRATAAQAASIRDRFRVALREAIESKLDNVAGMELEAAGDLSSLNDLGITEATVQSLTVDPITVEVHYTGDYEGGTKTIEVRAEAELVWEGVMSKSFAYPSVEAHQVELIDADLTDHDALVQVTADRPVVVTLLGVVTPDAESVDSLEFAGAEVVWEGALN